jgi:hypothetical protein
MAPRSPGRGLRGVLLAGAAVVALVFVLPAVLPSLNPFREETEDRSQPVLIKSLEDLSEYRAATANMQVVVDVEKDTKLVPSFIKGERTLFVAAGTVDAAVDFSGLSKDPDAVKVSADRTAVTITLPAPTLTEPRIDPDRTRVYDRDRGILDRVDDALSDTPGDEQPLYQLAETKLADAAAADPELIATAERNTRAMLQGMMRGLGFERVTIDFRQPRV